MPAIAGLLRFGSVLARGRRCPSCSLSPGGAYLSLTKMVVGRPEIPGYQLHPVRVVTELADALIAFLAGEPTNAFPARLAARTARVVVVNVDPGSEQVLAQIAAA